MKGAAEMDGNIQKYMAFVKTVEYGSFTRAAEALHYSQSGVSRMIRDLETEWKVALLERDRSGVRLTSDGMKLLPRVRELCRGYEELQRAVDELNGLEAGLIRIGTFSSVATHWLPNIIRAFQRDCPNIEYELLLGDYTEIETWVREGRVDCGFLRLPACPDFEVIPLEQDRLLAILPEGHPLAGAERVPASALCGEPFLMLERGGRADSAQVFQSRGLTPRVRFTTWDDYAIMSMVEQGLGVSILPELILRRVPYRIAARELEPPAYRRIGVVLRNRKSAPLAVRRFLEYLPCREAGPGQLDGES